MEKHKKHRRHIYLTEEIEQRMQEYCIRYNLVFSREVEQACRLYLDTLTDREDPHTVLQKLKQQGL